MLMADKPARKGRRLAQRIAAVPLKIIAAALIFVICCASITFCVSAAIVAVDVAQTEGGSYFAAFKERIVDFAKGAVHRVQTGVGDERAYLADQLEAMTQRQLETDRQLLAELDSGLYGLENPLAVVNPYGVSPFTAVVLFETAQPARISLCVAGDSPKACVEYTFSEYGTRHMLPVYGLYAARENTVTLAAEFQDGTAQETQLRIQTDALPDALTDERVRAAAIDERAVQSGFTFTSLGNHSAPCKAALDINGDFRWYLDTQTDPLLRFAGYCTGYGDSCFVSCGNRNYGPAVILEMNYLGKLLNAWYTPWGVHHDIEVTPDTLLVTGSTGADTPQALVYEIDRASGEILCRLDYAEILQPTRDQTAANPSEIDEFYTVEDWCHINSVCELGEDIVISARHQSTVACTDRAGNIKWLLADPAGYYEAFRQYLLTPVSDDFIYPITQHNAEVLPDQDGDPNTVDLLLFDNGDYVSAAEHNGCSRIVQYRIDEAAMTVEEVWSWGGDKPELYSYRHGSAQLLKNGNRLGSFEPYNASSVNRWAYGAEVDARGAAVWECWREGLSTHDYSEYRLERRDIYTDAANDIELGTEAKLFGINEGGK